MREDVATAHNLSFVVPKNDLIEITPRFVRHHIIESSTLFCSQIKQTISQLN
jgi:hypothetical protein